MKIQTCRLLLQVPSKIYHIFCLEWNQEVWKRRKYPVHWLRHRDIGWLQCQVILLMNTLRWNWLVEQMVSVTNWMKLNVLFGGLKSLNMWAFWKWCHTTSLMDMWWFAGVGEIEHGTHQTIHLHKAIPMTF